MSAEEDRDSTIAKMIHNLNPLFAGDGSGKSKRTSDDEDVSVKRIKYEKYSKDGSFNASPKFQTTMNQEFNFIVSPKERKSLDVSYVASPKESRRIRADLTEARTIIINLENRIKHMHGVRKEMELMFENETKGLTRQRDHDAKQIEQLERQLQLVRKQEAELKDELNDVRNKFEDYKLESEKNINELESNLAEMEDRMQDNDSREQEIIVDQQRKINDLSVVNETAQADLESYRQHIKEIEAELAEKNVQERNYEMKEHELQNALLKIKELEFANESIADWQQQAKSQQQKLAAYADLERENQRLKDETKRLKNEVHNKLLLEEQVFDLTTRLQNCKELEKKMASIQMNQTQTEMHIEEWRNVARTLCNVETQSDSSLPRLLRNKIENLQHKEVTLTSRKVELESQISALMHEVKSAIAEQKKTQKHLQEVQKGTQQTQSLVHRMQKKLLLVSRERDSYRQQLDSYERDLTMTIAPGGSNQQHFQSQKERIESLEKVIVEYRDLIEKMENDMKVMQPFASGDTPVPIRSEQIARMQEQIERLQAENERLLQRRDQLEMQLEERMIGEDTTEQRVVHLVNNPLSKCIEQNEAYTQKLKEEVERLRRKCRNLEEGLEASKLTDTSICPQEVQNLREQTKKAEIKVQRLKEHFKSSVQEFRDVIYMLFGYKVDKLSSTYKLTSMYAEKEDDFISFQMNSNGDLNVVETEFSSGLEDKKELHLHHQKSIPVFLSAITMDLFCNRTNVSIM